MWRNVVDRISEDGYNIHQKEERKSSTENEEERTRVKGEQRKNRAKGRRKNTTES